MKKPTYLAFNKNILLAWGVGLSYATGVFNWAHYFPDVTFIGDSSSVAVLAGFLVLFLLSSPLILSGISSITWFLMALVVALQPIINSISYADNLLFPFVALLLAGILSISVYSLTDKVQFIKHLAVMMLITGLLTLLVQFAQLFGLLTLPDNTPPHAMLNQHNVAAYVLAMSVAALFFVYYYWQLPSVWLLLCIFLFAIGNGMTTSRGGVILFFTVIFFMILFYQKGNKKIVLSILVLTVTVIGYTVGSWLLNIFLTDFESGIERFSSGAIYQRLSLLKQAWLIIQEQPFTGSGWGNFASEGLKNAENIRWFYFARHAHSLFPQIAAELGIIGLLVTVPALLSILSSIRLSLPSDKLFALGIIILTGLYSFSEFPLWYFYFLAVTVACIACLDNKIMWRPEKATSLLFIGLTVIISVGSLYYFVKYYGIAHSTAIVTHKYVPYEQKWQVYQQQENIFGFTSAKEELLFRLLPVNTEDLTKKIQFGERVVAHAPQPNNIMRLAQLYTLNKDNRALTLFKAACLYNEKSHCKKVTVAIALLAEDYPEQFGEINQRYLAWLNL